MIMTSIDKKLEKIQELSLKRKHKAAELRKNAAEHNASTTVVSSQEIELDLSFSNSSSSCTNMKVKYDDFVFALPKKTQVATSKSVVVPSTSGIFIQRVTSALERNKITDREAVRLIFPFHRIGAQFEVQEKKQGQKC